MIESESQGDQEISKEILDKIDWCGRCTKLYQKVGKICEKQKLKLLDGQHTGKLIIQCEKSEHIFSLTYKKAYNRLYFPHAHPKRLEMLKCSHCEKEVKEEMKEKRR